MAVPYLEHFLDSLEPLPADLQRNFTLMKDLDSRTHELMSKINTSSEEYVSLVNDMNPNEKMEKFNDIHELFEKAKVFSDDKVQLAMQTYEMVDKHIRRLDTELTKFEAELKDKHINANSNVPMVDGGKKKGRNTQKIKKSLINPKNIIKNDNEKGRKKHDAIKTEASLANANAVTSIPVLMTNTNEVLDMPVDPNEPTYCICHQVSYGEMIGCDNPDCPIEWFHFGCVSLLSKPKGKWFCPKCSVERKKK